ncbi:MAG: hypothetical protein ACFFA6_06880 [Promethearchaeota archaeon]
MPVYRKIGDYLEFINISTEKFTLFEWKPYRSFKRYDLDLNIIKQNPVNNIFFHLTKGNMKIVHIRRDNLIYTVGSRNEVQFQLLEALLDIVSLKFHDIYDVKVILSYGNFSTNIFNAFTNEIESIIDKFADLGLIKRINIECRVCNKILPLFVQKKFIENAESYPVPIVYVHEGHAILCFIDQNFDVRGVELVNITG